MAYDSGEETLAMDDDESDTTWMPGKNTSTLKTKTSKENASFLVNQQTNTASVKKRMGRLPKRKNRVNLKKHFEHLESIIHVLLGVKEGKKICKHKFKKLKKAIAPRKRGRPPTVRKKIDQPIVKYKVRPHKPKRGRPPKIRNSNDFSIIKDHDPLTNLQDSITKLQDPIIKPQEPVITLQDPLLIKLQDSIIKHQDPVINKAPRRKRGRPPTKRKILPIIKYTGPPRKRGRPSKITKEKAKLIVKLTNVFDYFPEGMQTYLKNGLPLPKAKQELNSPKKSPKPPVRDNIVWAKHSNRRFYKASVVNVKSITNLCLYFSDDQSFSKEVPLDDLENWELGEVPIMGQKLKVRREDGKVYDADCLGTSERHVYTVKFADCSVLEVNQDSILSYNESIPVNIASKIS